jgi:hypothetical protein
VAEYDSVIPAGGSGKLVAKIRTTPLGGRKLSKTIVVRTDSATTPTLTLRFTVDMEAPILFFPSARFVVSAVQGEEARHRVLLQRADGEALEVGGADPSHSTLEAVIEPVRSKERRDDVEAEPGSVWLELVLPAGAPVGTRTGRLRISTNHPTAAILEIPYVARVRPLIEPRPSSVRLWSSADGGRGGLATFISLDRNKAGSFTVTEVRVSHPDVFSAAAVSDMPASRQTLRVELTAGLDPEAIPGRIQGWIEIMTDDPVSSRFKVPVMVASSRQELLRGFRSH